ncbi:hypothetical protein G6F57_016633 [Rhizopus arrhizus]|nr:hypothetical protein G6F57_016633 [Rhizopus arrhizus]
MGNARIFHDASAACGSGRSVDRFVLCARCHLLNAGVHRCAGEAYGVLAIWLLCGLGNWTSFQGAVDICLVRHRLGAMACAASGARGYFEKIAVD